MDSKEVVFPQEVRKLVYMQLSTKKLQKTITCLSELDRKLAEEIYEERCLLFYQNAFADSPLWRYLPDLQQNCSLELYFQEVLPKSCSFQNLRSFYVEDYALTSDNVTSFINGVLKFLTQRRTAKHLQPQINLDHILKNIDFVVEKLQAQKESILEFLKNPKYSLAERLTIAKAYCHIESCLTVSALFVFGFNYIRNVENGSAALLVTDKHLMRWFSGSSLMWLELTDSKSGLIRRLIKCALKKEIDVALNIEQVEILLSRLSDQELFDYLPADGMGYQRDLLLKVIKAQHPLIHKIGPKTINRMIDKSADEELLCFLLEHLGAEKLSLALAMIHKPERWITIMGHEKFMTPLLENLTLKQSSMMVQGFTIEEFSCLINSEAFLKIIDQLDIDPPESFNESGTALDAKQSEVKLPRESRSKLLLELFNAYKSIFLDKKTPIYAHLTDADKRILGEQPKETFSSEGSYHAWPNFNDDEYVVVLPTYPLGYTDGDWNLNVDGPRVEKVDSDSKSSEEQANFAKTQKKFHPKSKKNDDAPLGLPTIPLSKDNRTPSIGRSGDLSSNKGPKTAKVSQKTQQDSQQTISQKIDSVPPQNNVLPSVIWSIVKGLFVGILVMGAAVLLLMFINYQMDVPLLEIINELWIAGVAGVFAEIVATACFLVDAAKGWGPSNTGSVNEKPDGPKSRYIPVQPTYTTDPTNSSKPLFPAGKAADTSEPQVQQVPTQTPVNNLNGTS